MVALDATQSGLAASGGVDPQAFVRRREGLSELDLMVRGATCAGCIARIEGGLREDDRVEQARLNLSTGRLALAWRGDPALAADYVRKLGRLGYPATPYEPEREADPTDSGPTLWVDADACPRVIKDILFRAATRTGIRLFTRGGT